MRKRRIKISAIEEDMCSVSVEISIVKSLSVIAFEVFQGRCVEMSHFENLLVVLDEKIKLLQDKFEKIEAFLKL